MNKPVSVTPREAKRIERRLDPIARLLWRLTSETGLRVSDALALRVGDVAREIDAWESKVKKIRRVILSEELYRDLRKQADERSPDHWLFPSIRDYRKPYSRMTYHRRLKAAQRSDRPSASAHSARKLFAQQVYRRAKDVAAVQQALQHTRIETTATYLDIDIERLLRGERPRPTLLQRIRKLAFRL